MLANHRLYLNYILQESYNFNFLAQNLPYASSWFFWLLKNYFYFTGTGTVNMFKVCYLAADAIFLRPRKRNVVACIKKYINKRVLLLHTVNKICIGEPSCWSDRRAALSNRWSNYQVQFYPGLWIRFNDFVNPDPWARKMKKKRKFSLTF
jgi:hypothetical protein